MTRTWRGALGDPSVGMTVFHYDRASNLYYFGRWGTSTYTESDNVGRRSKPRRIPAASPPKLRIHPMMLGDIARCAAAW